MREAFIDKRFGNRSLEMIGTINDILGSYEAQGYDLSLRQLYYQLVSRNIVENTERSYKNVGNIVSDARLSGLIDWDMIKDRGREMLANSHWDNPADIVRSAAQSFRIDRWSDQPNYVEVMVEKQALEGVLRPVCSELDVPFTANKGYSSSSAMYEASKRFLQRMDDGKELHVIYLGDHDPSGIDMTRDVAERLELFLGILPNSTEFNVHRAALNMNQIRELNPPENPAKITDSRAQNYISRFGRSSWELDAVEPSAMANLVRTAVNDLIDKPRWKESGKKQKSMRDELEEYADNYHNGC
jgi:hypothetical protein